MARTLLQVIYALYYISFFVLGTVSEVTFKNIPSTSIVDLLDNDWDKIQKGQWLVGFFDKDTKESMELGIDWKVFAEKCKDQNINVGRVFASPNPGLCVRFLVTTFPKVFYIKNGVAHEVKQATRHSLIDLIKDKKWNTLKQVNFLSNPFSIQMSLLSHLFIHAVNLYNFEDAIVQKYVPFSSATDVTFALTFIIVGTTFGLLMTVAFGLLQVMFMESKDSEEEENIKADEMDKKSGDEGEVIQDKDSNVRKRK